MNIREKLSMQLGSMLLSNIEVSDQLEGAVAELNAQKARADKLQADADAAAAAQAKHDAAVDTRDMPSGAPAPSA